jgi:hypothetical protein
MTGPGRTLAGEPVLERLGLGTSSLVELARRVAIVAAVAAVLCAATFALVESVATTTTVRRSDRGETRGETRGEARGPARGQERPGSGRRARWSAPMWARAPGEITIQLIIIGIAAVAGRKVLRLRL